MPRPTGPQSYTCGYCTETFTRTKLNNGKPPQYCNQACWDAWRHRQRPFGEWRKANPNPPRDFTCQDCGTTGYDAGFGPRATRCDGCVVAHERRKSLQWQRENPEQAASRRLRWASDNPEKVRATYERGKEKYFARQREYRRENIERARAWGRDKENRRRAIKAAVTVENFRSADIFARDGWTCGICGQPVDPDLRWPARASASLDHIVPLSRGGVHALSNVQLAHLACNIAKGASLP